MITVRPQDTLRQAIQTMALRSISCVVVTELLPGPGSRRERPVGILTERDILQLRRLELSIGTTTVAEVMSSPLRCIHPSDDLADVREQMQRMRVRRVVVTNQAGDLVGLITETNLMQSIDPVDLFGVYEIMQRQVQVLSESRLELLNRRRFDFSRALREQEFWLAYQPQLDLRSGSIRSAEALIRWNSPQHGPVPPNDFIPLAEHSGFIVELGQWILTTACQQVRQWMDQGKQPIRMAVNVTAHQLLEPRFVSQVMATQEQSGLPPEQLTLELTESVLVENNSATADCFQKLQQEGVRISIDDFGTGYASLSYLQHFHFNELKIDRSFVSHIDTNHKGQVIVRSVLDLARTMGFTTVAEGVETTQATRVVATGRLRGDPGLPGEPARPRPPLGARLAQRGPANSHTSTTRSPHPRGARLNRSVPRLVSGCSSQCTRAMGSTTSRASQSIVQPSPGSTGITAPRRSNRQPPESCQAITVLA
ncbi:MAG: EAL domain-containing protein [Synechococcus sp.]